MDRVKRNVFVYEWNWGKWRHWTMDQHLNITPGGRITSFSHYMWWLWPLTPIAETSRPVKPPLISCNSINPSPLSDDATCYPSETLTLSRWQNVSRRLGADVPTDSISCTLKNNHVGEGLIFLPSACGPFPFHLHPPSLFSFSAPVLVCFGVSLQGSSRIPRIF